MNCTDCTVVKSYKEVIEKHKALQCHLRDDTAKVSAKAHNVAEEAEERLQLALSALLRDEPKIASAAHQIELVLDILKLLKLPK